MSSVRIAVRLKAPDPEAVSALNAMSTMGLQLPPARLARFDIWEFKLASGDRSTVEEMVGHFTDIVNPNKHLWAFVEPGDNPVHSDDALQWSGVLVKDLEDSQGSNWTAILQRRGFPVEEVHRGTLWMFGYLKDLDDSLVSKLAADLAVSNTRTGGLLSNPVFQEVHPWT